MQHKAITFLLANMQEMETELRAQSITLDALSRGVVRPADIRSAMSMARSSTAMLALVNQKYRCLREDFQPSSETISDEDLHLLAAAGKSDGIVH